MREQGILFLILLTLGATPSGSAQTRRPNVILLLADDLRADAIGALAGDRPAAKTPHLDALVRSGFAFRNAYCLGSNVPAVCLPSRNMMLSGRAYFRWEGPYAPGDPPNLPLSLEAAGYSTYHHGKRGNVALEIEKRFNRSAYLDDDKERTSGQPGKTIVDRAIQFLEGRKESRDRRPFFLYLAFEAPHDPRVAAREFRDRYDPSLIALPANFRPLHPFDNGEMTVRDEQLAPWPRTEAEIRRHLHDYWAVISGLDHHIGRLIRALEDRGEFANTIIVFASDNGLAVGSHGLMGKQSLYDHSAKVPLVLAGPGIPRGSSDALAYLMDVYPTLCDLVGAQVPAGLDGMSLGPILRGESRCARDSLFLSYRDVQRAVRDDRWKLIRYPRIGLTQLFDLARDPDEMHDRSADPEQGPRIARMLDLMRDWQHRLGDEAPLSYASPRDPRFVPPGLEKGSAR